MNDDKRRDVREADRVRKSQPEALAAGRVRNSKPTAQAASM